ncbi:hypothetical protein LLH00_12615, partial [bacterium]|nr:hypothetical protein [bacterium]
MRETSAALGGLSLFGASLAGPVSAATPSAAATATATGAAGVSLIGAYGDWAASLLGEGPGTLSFRRPEFTDLKAWRERAHGRTLERMAVPEIGPAPEVKVNRKYTFDGLEIEELSWQLPYGRPSEAYLLKPAGATGKLPGILALHDHGGWKYFGKRKITKTSAEQHPMIVEHQKADYGGRAWANEVARRGYVVLVHDTFPFASRRVLLRDVPEVIRRGLTDDNPEEPKNVEAYNNWASDHESIMAKSLFCAGTTWPGVYFAEDRVALDILCARPEVDPERVG